MLGTFLYLGGGLVAVFGGAVVFGRRAGNRPPATDRKRGDW